MLKLTMSNFFSKRTQLAPTLVIIDVSQIVDFKIDHQQACKLLYKVI